MTVVEKALVDVLAGELADKVEAGLAGAEEGARPSSNGKL